jgi:hypothetical protein
MLLTQKVKYRTAVQHFRQLAVRIRGFSRSLRTILKVNPHTR